VFIAHQPADAAVICKRANVGGKHPTVNPVISAVRLAVYPRAIENQPKRKSTHPGYQVENDCFGNRAEWQLDCAAHTNSKL
jgi:hypothetical protein